jgi:integrase
MATINFFIQSKNNPAGIYVRLRDGRKVDAKAKTRFIINPSEWSSIKGQPKNVKDENSKKLNNELHKLSSDLLNQYNLVADKETITTQWLKDFISPPKQTESIPHKLLDYFDYFAMHNKSSVKSSTFSTYKSYKHFFERFQKDTKCEYLIKDVNADFKLKFEAYCAQNNYAKNTVARAMKAIKTMCYHARNNGIETHFQLNSITVKSERVDKVFLSLEEIKQIQNTEFKSEDLSDARDWLVISCETGQRVSDFMRFTKEMIRYEGAVPLIEFTQVKTGKKMAIPLSKTVLAILEKQKGDFPKKINAQKYNEYIKEVCKQAGMKQKVSGSKIDLETNRKNAGLFPKYELITSHIGRRSFATNNYGRIPTSLLISVTGHSTENMFLEYIGKTVTEKAIQLAEYF